MKILLLVIVSFTIYNVCGAGIEDNHILRFGDELSSEGEYYRAITEYRRFLSYYPQDINVPKTKLKIANCLLNGGKPLEAIEWCRRVQQLDNDTIIRWDIKLIMAQCFLKLENYSETQKVLSDVVENKLLSSFYTDNAHYMLGLSYVGDGKWGIASKQFKMVSDSAPYKEKLNKYSIDVLQGNGLSLKNPSLATLLSIVPGLGYLYTGNIQTGISSIIVNGVFGWGTYNAFRKDEKGVGIVIGIFSVGWYTGNIYGGYASAVRYDERNIRDFKSQFK
jgi:hypothetical protein